MSKTFTYSRQCGPSSYSEYTDEEFYDEEDFEYEVSADKVIDALSELIFNDYFSNILSVKENKKTVLRIKNAIDSLIKNCDMEETLSDIYEDELKDYFQEDAFNSLDD